jgi:hypothetical protein
MPTNEELREQRQRHRDEEVDPDKYTWREGDVEVERYPDERPVDEAPAEGEEEAGGE